MTQKQCNHCLKWKDETEFSWRWKALGIRNPSCKDCQYEHNKKYYEGSGKERHLQQVSETLQISDVRLCRAGSGILC